MSDDGRGSWSAAWGVGALVFGGVATVMWAVVVSPHGSAGLILAIIFSIVSVGGFYMCLASLGGWWPAQQMLSGGKRRRAVQVARARLL